MPRGSRKVNDETSNNSLAQAIIEIKSHPILNPKKEENKQEIADIITFCNSPHLLALPESKLKLWLSQRVILKCFYMGSVGNETLTLSKEEWEWLYSNESDEERDGSTYKKNIKDVIRKVLRRNRDGAMPYFKELHLVLGRRSSKCHEENQIISTTVGSIKFLELHKRLKNNEKIGICTYNPETLKRSLTYDIKTEINGVVECYTVETKRGVRETASWNHPYLVWRNEWEKPRFIEVCEILPGDRIAIAEKTELFGFGGIGVNRAALLGHLQGDGGTTNAIVYSTACPIMLEDFKSLIEKEFPKYNVKYKSQYDYTVTKENGRKKQNGSQKNEIAEWLREIDCFGKKSINKEIPECIYKGSKEEVSAFLSRLYGCDGWGHVAKEIKGHGGVPRSWIGYCSSSEKLAYGVKHLLQKFGIHAVVDKRFVKLNGKSFQTWKVIFSRKEDLEIFEKEINIFSKEKKVREVIDLSRTRVVANSEFDGIPMGVWTYIKKLTQEKNLSQSDVLGKHGSGHNDRLRKQYSPNKNKVLSYGRNTGDAFLTNIGSSDVKWDEVKTIMPVGKRNTIAIEVDGTNIIGGDFVSHNTLIASIITAYEAYKLLVINGGDPHSYYNLPADDEIAIINVALSQQQAGRLFGQVQSRIRNSPFFMGRIAKETTSEIRLYTNRDLEKKSKGATLGVPGSILLLCGHSNPDSLAGYSTIMILFDEIAFYDETGKVTGKYFYGRLKPSLSKFFNYNAARIVQISSPSGKMGVFYETAMDAARDDDNGNSILSFQLPTWCMNPDIPYENMELARDRLNNIELFNTEYGAQWSEGGSLLNYFDPGLIDRCIRGDLNPHRHAEAGFNYYMHIDPAKSGANYAAVLVAKKRYVNNQGQKRNKCYLAGTWVWRPVPGMGLLFGEIDKQIIQICSIFRPVAVTYDDYHSMQSVQLLRSHGINTQTLSYNRNVKAKIYQNLRDLMGYQPEPELLLYDVGGESSLLIAELKALKQKHNQRGVSIVPDKTGDIRNDDLCVHPNTIVFTDIPKRIKDVKINEMILTHDGTYRKIIDKKEHKDFNKILKAHFHYGLPIIGTDNHPVEVFNEKTKTRSWKAIGDLRNSDFVVRSWSSEENPFRINLSKYIKTNQEKNLMKNNFLEENRVRDRNSNAKWHNLIVESSNDFGYLCGLFLSEGSISDHGIAIAANINETDVHKKLSDVSKRLFGFKDSGHIKSKDNDGSQSTINSQIVKRLFLDLFGGKKAGEKYIPAFMVDSNEEFILGLLNGLFDGDGCYSKTKNSFVYTTTSDILATQVSSILLKLGIVSNINHIKRKGRINVIRGRLLRFNYDLYNVFISNTASFNKLKSLLCRFTAVEDKKQSKFHKNSNFIFGKDFVAYKIRKIEEDYVETVVNLTVEKNHSYVSGCVNSHNCDCLAGACSSACEGLKMGLPEPVTVRMAW